MFSDSFTPLEHGKAAKILDQLNPLLDGSAFDASVARILKHTLPFYNGCELVEVSDYDVNPPRKVSFIYKEGNPEPVYILTGTNEPIYHLNKSTPVFLNEENICTYVLFFFSYVRGSYGRFNIVQGVDEINWREEPAPSGRKALGRMISPVTLKSANENGSFDLIATIVFRDSLFESSIHVDENGNVNMSNQEMLVENIPVLDDHFGQ